MNQPLPNDVLQALNSLSGKGVRPGYYLWPVGSIRSSLTTVWTKRVAQLSTAVSLEDEHGKPMQFRSHMLRDTFAVELLLAGMSMDKVSKLLTHKSTRITEKYYAPWVKARREQLEDEMIKAMRTMGASFAGD